MDRVFAFRMLDASASRCSLEALQRLDWSDWLFHPITNPKFFGTVPDRLLRIYFARMFLSLLAFAS